MLRWNPFSRPVFKAPSRSQPKRALLAWEFGAGRTHIVDLLGVAGHLRRAGFECLATLYDNRFDAEFAALGIRTVQNFVWPAWRRNRVAWPRPTPRNLSDILANNGIADPYTLAGAIAHYDTIFSLFPPDIVICEGAYGAVLAARDRCPAVLIGSAELLPPVVEKAFPPLFPGHSKTQWDPALVCAGINRGLERAGRFPINSVGDLMGVAGVFPFGPPPFDPYNTWRQTPVLPPHLPGYRDPSASAAHAEVFVYLHGFIQTHGKLMEALLGVERPMRVHIPELTDENAARLRGRGIHVELAPVPLADILERSRCVVHHGGPQLTTACLAAGLPQLILPKEIVNVLTATYVREGRLGGGAANVDCPPNWAIAETRRCYDDQELQQRCKGQVVEHRAWLAGDPCFTVAAAVCSLLGVPPPEF